MSQRCFLTTKFVFTPPQTRIINSRRYAERKQEAKPEPLVTLPETYDWTKTLTMAPLHDNPRLQHFLSVMKEIRRDSDFQSKTHLFEFDGIFRAFTGHILSGVIDPIFFHFIVQYHVHYLTGGDAEVKSTFEKEEQENLLEELKPILLPLFVGYAKARFPNDNALYELAIHLCDMTRPLDQYIQDRKVTRRVIYHAGPTNSGKTHNAIQALAKAESGVYLSPLRLLAQEVFTKLNKQYNVKCSLQTGQEIRPVHNAAHLACTVEMLNLRDVYDVAVIDEIQMIGDPDRGRAWTRAVLGLQCRELHLCGDPTAIPLIERLCKEQLGESFEVVRYDRMTPLNIEKSSLKGSVQAIQDRDCIVVFNRKDIYKVKRWVETLTKKKCCVIYGSLPPQTRAEQAQLYADKDSGYTVLVASDAIGMGLNLDIRRIVFYQMKKFTREKSRIARLEPPLVRQIAGRAGRRGFHEVGHVTTFTADDLSFMHSCITQAADTIPDIQRAGLYPEYEQLEQFANKLYSNVSSETQGIRISEVLEKYVQLSKVNPDFFMCTAKFQIDIAKKMDHLPLTLKQQYDFCHAPVTQFLVDLLVNYAEQFCSTRSGTVKIGVDVDTIAANIILNMKKLNEKDGKLPVSGMAVETSIPAIQDVLQDIEECHRIIDLYQWLAQKYPLRFDAQMANQVRERLLEQLADTISMQTLQNVQFNLDYSAPKTADLINKKIEAKSPKEKESIHSILSTLATVKA
jgi:ATP-dependent RNA helicase SUPV3L1/SUV3